MRDVTPVEEHGGILCKRDDLFEIAGICGGKVRACWHLASTRQPKTGGRDLVTASSRKSPQAQIVARIAEKLGVAARLHMPQGAVTPEMQDMMAHGGTLHQHKAGYNSVICARAKADSEATGAIYIPFGMEHREAMDCTRRQVASLLPLRHAIKRIVIPIGSGMSAAGVLWGLYDAKWYIPVLGVQVGAAPFKRLDQYAPPLWRNLMRVVVSKEDYHTAVEGSIGDVKLDPIYEAKCLPFIEHGKGDLLWIVGIRVTPN